MYIKQPILVVLLEIFLLFHNHHVDASGDENGNLYPASDKIIKDNKIDFSDPDCDFDCQDYSHLCLEDEVDCEEKADECPYSCGICEPCDLESAQRVETALGALDKEIDQLRALLDKLIPGCMTDQDCMNGGTCNEQLKCQCKRGFTGHLCERDINECFRNPCGANSKCINTKGSFRCQCNDGFEFKAGSRTECKKHVDCVTDINCLNGGKCNTDGKCECRTGFRGKTCQMDIDECVEGTSQCDLATGSCKNNLGGYTCECNEGFVRSKTNSFDCVTAPACTKTADCQNSGICMSTGTCQCAPGFTGKNCEHDVNECWTGTNKCNPVISTCFNLFGSYKCNCKQGYVRKAGSNIECEEIKDCRASTDCKNGGVCLDSHCVCKTGFTGKTCDYDVNECLKGSHECDTRTSYCFNTHGTYQCKCKQGFIVDPANPHSCKDKPTCTKNFDCQNGGSCNSIGKCECAEGFQGKLCEHDVDECSDGSNQCDSTLSKCYNTKGSYVCVCKAGYELATGSHTLCQRPPDCKSSADCLNGGTCSPEGKCVCKSGFTGKTCAEDVNECEKEANQCDEKTTTCKNIDGTYTCHCKEGLEPKPGSKTSCQKPPNCKTSADCLNGGTCSPVGNCVCKSGFQGERCAEDVNECAKEANQCDEKTTTCKNIDGTYTCQCKDGFTPNPASKTSCLKPDCIYDADCLNDGKCTANKCECKHGFYGKQCETDVDECASAENICDPLTSTCKNVNGSFFCACKEGLELEKGSRTKCAPPPLCDDKHDCENDGECNSEGECDCTEGFSGRRCEQDVDECTLGTNECSSDSVCENTLGSYHCNCDDGFVLEENSTTECIPKPDCMSDAECLNDGKCIDQECNCTHLFTGDTCEEDVDECTLNVDGCEAYSMCENIVGGYNCKCNEGYVLKDGSETECEKAPSCQHDNDCENDGTCNDVGVCECSDGYSGVNCEKDVDECSTGADGCDINSACENTVGGYNCNCDQGYKPKEGSKTECISDLCHNNPCGSNTACKETNGTYSCKCSDECEMAPEITNSHGQLNCSWFAKPSDWINEGSCENSCGKGKSMYRERKCIIKKENSAGECETTYFDPAVDKAERGCTKEQTESETVECGVCEATDLSFQSASNDTIPEGMKVVDIVVEKANGDTCKLSISDELLELGDTACELDDGFSLGPDEKLVNMAMTYNSEEEFKWDSFKFTMNGVTYVATDNSNTAFKEGKIETYELTAEEE